MSERASELEDGAAGLISTARALAADAVCAEVVAALRQRGIDSVLLKGSTVAEWLYRGDVRGYVDTDLLIDPDRLEAAADVLKERGFAPVPVHVSEHSHPWLRDADGAEVDVHATLWGSHLSASQVWEVLQDSLERKKIGDVPVLALNLPARALLVVLHAAQHRDDGKPHPRTDLRRAIERTDEATWREADELAYRLMVLTEMADGLVLEPEGARLIERLPFVRAAAVGRSAQAPLAIGFERLAQARGIRAKITVIVHAVVRPRDELRIELAPPPKGGRELMVAYVRRALWLVVGVPRTIVALRRARRRSASERSSAD